MRIICGSAGHHFSSGAHLVRRESHLASKNLCAALKGRFARQEPALAAWDAGLRGLTMVILSFVVDLSTAGA